jgi:putative addiction module component (TIGR02574 family)
MHTVRMSLTLDQIVEEARQLPREQSAELIDRLLADAVDTPDAEIEQAWKTETRRRIAEIESGVEPGVPGEQAMAELRRIVGR